MLNNELDFFLANQEEYAKAHFAEFVAIANSSVIGFFKTEEEAYKAALKSHDLGTFLIRQCLPASQNNVQAFHSRVAFV